MTEKPTLLVHLDDAGKVSWKPKGVKGARWHQAKSFDDAVKEARAVLETPTDIEYVATKD